MSIRATVIGGRLVVDEPTSLPEGTVLDLVVDDAGRETRAQGAEALAAPAETDDASIILAELRTHE